MDDLVVAMRDALTQPVEALQEMGHVGSQRVQERHNAETEAKVLAKLFKGT